MAILAQQSISQENISMRWQEPYASAGLNKKGFKTTPRGVYRGFVVVSVSGTNEVQVVPESAAPGSGYQGGLFDAAVSASWNVAVHESLGGYTTTVRMQTPVSGYLASFDLSLYAGTEVFIALDIQYSIGFPTEAQIKVVEAADLDTDPTLLVLAKVEVPPSGTITSSNIIIDDANYPRILPYATPFKEGFMSKAQASIVAGLEVPGASNAFEAEFVVASSGPQTVGVPNANTYVVGGNDLFIFRNGLKATRGRDYTEIDRGDGRGDEIQWIGTTLQANDRLVFRGQEYAVALTSTLAVLDETTLVAQSVTRMNFVGTGVAAMPDGPGRVKIVIPAASNSNSRKSKINNGSTPIPAYRVVTLLSDGSITLCDPNIPGHRPYGITSQFIAPASFGEVFLDGVAFNAIANVSGIAVGQDLYLSHAGDGMVTPIPPDPTVAPVFRIGIADCPDAIASSTATDIVFDRQRII